MLYTNETETPPPEDTPLRICLLTYRGNPHCGGQGVYIHYLSKALADLGHSVDVISGPPHPVLHPGITPIHLPSLDLYNPARLFRTPTLKELMDPVNLLEWLSVSTMGFPEPFTFGKRAHKFLTRCRQRYDIVHDNQSLSHGVRRISKMVPTVATIHHPITIDRDITIRSTPSYFKKLQHLRWYSFIGMQKRVARHLPRIITVSQKTRADLHREFSLSANRLAVVFNGIDTGLFQPRAGISREPDRIITTTSADTPLKGLKFLLKAVARISKQRNIRLIVIGEPHKNGMMDHLKALSIQNRVTFTGRVSNEALVVQYARASVAVVPSVYEGFGFPAGEAMACGLPVVATSGGALPEVIGDAGVVVPPGDPDALAGALLDLLGNREKALHYGRSGINRVRRAFSWEYTAKRTIDIYRETIRDYHRF